MSLENVRVAIDKIRSGGMIILTDDEDRENEGDLCFAAEFADAEKINFMAKYGRGLICLSLGEAEVEKLGLPMMVTNNSSPYGTAFTVSIEAAEGVSTGISAEDRARTIQAAIADDYKTGDLVSPGHVFPLRSRNGGVLVRSGQTEGSVDFSRLAGLKPGAVICEIMNDDGTMMRRDSLIEFGKEHDIPLVSVAELIEYRLSTESLVRLEREKEVLIGDLGEWKMQYYSNSANDVKYLCFVKNPEKLIEQDSVMVRVHRQNIIRDMLKLGNTNEKPVEDVVFKSLKMIMEEDCGVLLYIPSQDANDRFYNQVEKFFDDKKEVSAGALSRFKRNFGLGAQVLKSLGINKIRLLTTNPSYYVGIGGYNLEIQETIQI